MSTEKEKSEELLRRLQAIREDRKKPYTGNSSDGLSNLAKKIDEEIVKVSEDLASSATQDKLKD